MKKFLDYQNKVNEISLCYLDSTEFQKEISYD